MSQIVPERQDTFIGTQTVQTDFYGITVGQSDDEATFRGINVIKFEAANFYVTQNANIDEVQVSFRGIDNSEIDHGAISGLSDDDHTQYIRVDGSRAFTGDQSMGGNRLTNVGTPIAGTDSARFQDIGPGFYGIVVRDDDTAVRTDSLRFRSRDFDVNVEGDGAAITLAPEIRAAGFYLNPGVNGIGRSLVEDIISFDIPIVNIETYFFESFVDQGFIIDNLHIITASGSATVGFYIREDGEHGRFGIGIPGLDPVSVSSNKVIAMPTGNNVVNSGDSVLVSVFQNTSAKHLRGRLKIKLAG